MSHPTTEYHLKPEDGISYTSEDNFDALCKLFGTPAVVTFRPRSFFHSEYDTGLQMKWVNGSSTVDWEFQGAHWAYDGIRSGYGGAGAACTKKIIDSLGLPITLKELPLLDLPNGDEINEPGICFHKGEYRVSTSSPCSSINACHWTQSGITDDN